ncbi:alpha,alpha-trehalase TreF [Rhodonellum sp.]|uniref:alpha,alpha-trehalase TreF n=1 Tax=Rhodonellum sp. TaxID=2231180 RepID=UPI00271588A1|nr:alpha,alpha-trehalase TreF [Rhodonellum sp.]MDO9552286.1 alpha,alpha-trehalase TreF [Rhodonellum sp.]
MKTPLTPETMYGELFEAVQLGGVFQDSKMFVDAIPQKPVAEILRDFRESSHHEGFSLVDFVRENFKTQAIVDSAQLPRDLPLEKRLHLQWDLLERAPDQQVENSSLIPLPKAYIVPGGRFGEIYYWDSYFTLLGLKVSGKTALMASMVDNFAHLIETVGHIPNGNRSYFISRSQPPFFAKMVELLAEVMQDEKIFLQYLPAMLKEYDFWMAGADQLNTGEAISRVVKFEENIYLNRYYDDLDTPRPESFVEDLELLESAGNTPELLRQIRAACESGWDFSSRWLKDPMELKSIETFDLLPVDLNVLMAEIERIIAKSLAISDRIAEAEAFVQKWANRKKAIQQHFWDDRSGLFLDIHWKTKETVYRPSLAAFFPLWTNVAHESQAERVLEYAEKNFLKPGGLVTSNQYSGQQWDAPNGWAPLQWIGFLAMHNYGNNELALDLAHRWTQLNEQVFERTGKMMEKYNVEDLSQEAGGGEYPVQDGFGWTNGVFLAMKEWMKKQV